MVLPPMRTFLAPILGLVLAAAPPDEAARNDAYLAGYLTAILERELGWPRETFRVEVAGGIATLALPREETRRGAEAQKALAGVEGLQGLNVVLEDAGSSKPRGLKALAQAARNAGHLTPRSVMLPSGVLFAPLIADPKEPQSFASLQRADPHGSPIGGTRKGMTLGNVGMGGSYGLWRWLGREAGDGFQVGIDGAIFAQFDMGSESTPLINADYTVGVPLTYRRGRDAFRLRIWHQSSHLGDEFILDSHPSRVNLSFMAVQLLASREGVNWRGYGGLEWIGNRDPVELRKWSALAGVEYREKVRRMRYGRFVGGLSLKFQQENDWRPGGSLKAGIEFGPPEPGNRHLRVMLEAYSGYMPWSQYVNQRLDYVGFGAYFNF